jgi:uncharacterized protein YcaQ
MGEITLTKQQARQFILRKQGLIGNYRFTGKDGILAFIRQVGCIQFDPIDVCGKNAELVLQSRIKGFTKKMLYDLLYQDRSLIDYFDKNLAIMAVEDWPYFERTREANRHFGRSREEVDKITGEIKAAIAKRGPLSSKDIDYQQKIDWYWSSTKLARAALETLYFRGDLIIHHKKGTVKYYALAKDYIPKKFLETGEPFPKEKEHLKWRVLRRISAVGLLWNKPSDAWLGIGNLKAENRNLIFQELQDEQKIIEIQVEGFKDAFFCLAGDLNIIKEVKNASKFKIRTELIAPLDCMLWDRKLIKQLFDFDYKWEIYTPKEQRKFGYYVLPILMGDTFAGRCEVLADNKKKTLYIRNVWLEKNTKPSKMLQTNLDRCFRRFMKFHELEEMEYANDFLSFQ